MLPQWPAQQRLVFRAAAGRRGRRGFSTAGARMATGSAVHASPPGALPSQRGVLSAWLRAHRVRSAHLETSLPHLAFLSIHFGAVFS